MGMRAMCVCCSSAELTAKESEALLKLAASVAKPDCVDRRVLGAHHFRPDRLNQESVKQLENQST
jgi:hypothetical protein